MDRPKLSAVHCAVQTIAEAVAQLPLITYERKGDAQQRATDHPA